ncbi:hypothetical protein [Allobranchiibius huperziae]|uniref:Putative membrane protein n=1 Tax=Allobranchiibius huperziae TaxID=1874116 RepID=A0A853DDL9_9MICO|nr:hypothetical protein [Allobranchiibius huperziae]NYJ73184.1 putative membrane protein [Allobranchiibius huperziae]
MDVTVAVAVVTAASTLMAGFGAVGLTTWIQHKQQRSAAKRRLIAVVDAAVITAASGLGSAAALARVDSKVSQRLATLVGIARPVDGQRALETVLSHVWILVEAVAEARQLGDDILYAAIRAVHDCYMTFQEAWTEQIGNDPRHADPRNLRTEDCMRSLLASLENLRHL